MTTRVEQLLAAYPTLRSIPPSQFAETVSRLPVVRVEQGTELFSEGSPCSGFPCVLSGQVRVARGSRDGRELELYRVGPGDICVVSAGCVFNDLPMSAHGHAATATELALVDRDTLLEWTDARPFRRFLLGVMAERISALSVLVEAVAFQRLDRRLAQRLLAAGNVQHTTHQQLADDLGTARENVSRLLGRFEDRRLVQLGRERIELIDLPGLRSIASDEL